MNFKQWKWKQSAAANVYQSWELQISFWNNLLKHWVAINSGTVITQGSYNSAPISNQHQFQLDTNFTSTPISTHHQFQLNTNFNSTPILNQYQFQLETISTRDNFNWRQFHNTNFNGKLGWYQVEPFPCPVDIGTIHWQLHQHI